jgi:hypothetical protein
MRLEAVKRTEWIIAILLSLIVLFLLIARAKHAGGLWRDECAAVQLARMPSFADIARNFQHEAFPLLFPATIRAWTNVFGTSDAALRCFGLAVGVMLVCVVWFNSRVIGSGVPLLSLTLIGLNTSFLTWGTSIRGYGFGSVLIVLAFGLILKVILEPTLIRITVTSLVCLASVHCLLHNTVLLLTIGLSAVTLCLVRHQLKRAIVILGVGMLCLTSLLPYAGPYSSGSAWNIVVISTVTLSSLWSELNSALGKPSPIIAWVWYISVLTLIGGSVWRLYVIRHNKASQELDFLLFGILVSITSVIGYYVFLRVLSYTTRAWYYLALISALGAALDLLAANLSKIGWIRLARLTFAIMALIGLPLADWPKIIERQTSIDIVAHKLEESAAPADLIVVSPWQFGIPFSWYYHGATPWVTLPVISDHQIHRYDLFKAKMVSPRPIDDVANLIGATLRSGRHVWLVGGIKLPPDGEAALSLPPAPNSKFGWDNVAYMESWKQQMGVFVHAHALRGNWVSLAAGTVNNLESVPLAVVQGWRD